jgi:hypothetical protein
MGCACGTTSIPAGGVKAKGAFPSSSASAPIAASSSAALSGKFCMKCFGFWALVALVVIIVIHFAEKK